MLSGQLHKYNGAALMYLCLVQGPLAFDQSITEIKPTCRVLLVGEVGDPLTDGVVKRAKVV